MFGHRLRMNSFLNKWLEYLIGPGPRRAHPRPDAAGADGAEEIARYALDGPAGHRYNFASPLGGAIAQLGERYNGIVEVIGSIPISSTT